MGTKRQEVAVNHTRPSCVATNGEPHFRRRISAVLAPLRSSEYTFIFCEDIEF
jgi:hypothetical protein